MELHFFHQEEKAAGFGECGRELFIQDMKCGQIEQWHRALLLPGFLQPQI